MRLKRQITDTLLRYVAQFPVVGITGPRQSVKTTFGDTGAGEDRNKPRIRWCL